ncbi:MAG: ATP-grasp domain-containing protein [Alistipes sp.]|nr:ATP-grasp domain-containing protein [Alistipes sp.]
MKIMILAGGNDQAALIQELRSKFKDVEVILIDFAPNVVAAKYADKHIVESTMDLHKVKEIAIAEEVNYIMTACGDQPLLTMAVVSEELGLPCCLSKKQVLNLTNKMYMKQLMIENDIPTSKFKTFTSKDELDTKGLNYPLVVKPVDSNGSKGVRKVLNEAELNEFAKDAFRFTLTDTIIVEEFNEGVEISADFYVINGEAQKVMWCQLNKFQVNESTQIIYQSVIPPVLSEKTSTTLIEIANKIAKAYEVKNSPLLIQAIINNHDVRVIEFSARLGGGAKYKTIEHVTGFNVLRANLESMLGELPEVKIHNTRKCYSRCHIYLTGGKFMAIEGLDELVKNGIIKEYILTRPFGVNVNAPASSSDRVASIFIEAKEQIDLDNKVKKAISTLKVLDENGNDILNRDMYL